MLAEISQKVALFFLSALKRLNFRFWISRIQPRQTVVHPVIYRESPLLEHGKRNIQLFGHFWICCSVERN
jgi:hypothetical protein